MKETKPIKLIDWLKLYYKIPNGYTCQGIIAVDGDIIDDYLSGKSITISSATIKEFKFIK